MHARIYLQKRVSVCERVRVSICECVCECMCEHMWVCVRECARVENVFGALMTLSTRKITGESFDLGGVKKNNNKIVTRQTSLVHDQQRDFWFIITLFLSFFFTFRFHDGPKTI